MDKTMKIYWDVVRTQYPTKKMIREFANPVRRYECEMIDGAVIDIGCGQNSMLLDYLDNERDFIAVDNENFQLEALKERIAEINPDKLNQCEFITATFPKDELPRKDYSLIMSCNLLHFFTLEECIGIGRRIAEMSQKGTLIFIEVHSDKHYCNAFDEPERYSYFKHYFTIEDFDKVFPSEQFDRLYVAEREYRNNLEERGLIRKWIYRTFREVHRITNPKEIEPHAKEYLSEQRESSLQVIFKRK